MSYSPYSNISISWDATNQYVFVVSIGFSPTEVVQAKYDEMLDLLRQEKASKMLLDIREIALFSKDLGWWIVSDWEPRAIAVGLKAQAFVVPENFFTRKILIGGLNRYPKAALRRAFFDSVEGARQWLNTF